MFFKFKQLDNSPLLKRGLFSLINSTTLSRMGLSTCLGLCFVLNSTETEAQSLAYGEYLGENGEGAPENRKRPQTNNPSPTETGNLIRHLENGGEVQYNPYTEASDSESTSSQTDKNSDQSDTSIYSGSLFDLTEEDIYKLINAVTDSFSDEDFDQLRRLIEKNEECLLVKELDPKGKRNLGAYINAQCGRRYLGRKTASAVLKEKIKYFIIEKLTEAGAKDQEELERVAEQMAGILEEAFREAIVGLNDHTDLKYLWELIYGHKK